MTYSTHKEAKYDIIMREELIKACYEVYTEMQEESLTGVNLAASYEDFKEAIFYTGDNYNSFEKYVMKEYLPKARVKLLKNKIDELLSS